MKKTGRMMGAAVLFMAGVVPAERPVPTSAPAGKNYDTARLLLEQDEVRGCVVEMKNISCSGGAEADTSGTYRFELFTQVVGEKMDNPSGRLGYLRVVTSEEGTLRMRYADPKTLYVFIGNESIGGSDLTQKYHMTVVGEDYVKNKDGSVRYIWPEVDVQKIIRNPKRYWAPYDIYVLGKYFDGPNLVIQVRVSTRFGIEEIFKNEATGEITGWFSEPWAKKSRVQIIFPPEAEEFLKKFSEKENTDAQNLSVREKLERVVFYAKVEKTADGEIKVRALGTRKRGREDYRW